MRYENMMPNRVFLACSRFSVVVDEWKKKKKGAKRKNDEDNARREGREPVRKSLMTLFWPPLV